MSANTFVDREPTRKSTPIWSSTNRILFNSPSGTSMTIGVEAEIVSSMSVSVSRSSTLTNASVNFKPCSGYCPFAILSPRLLTSRCPTIASMPIPSISVSECTVAWSSSSLSTRIVRAIKSSFGSPSSGFFILPCRRKPCTYNIVS